jgi:molybdopterin/thiamine biosynthesis adenylyltransferase|tara:strand:+ start:23 stop:775 length:753 start_codon:yes stop_codon:yes gene_type:complete
MKITNKELKKFSKQIILKKIGIAGQKKLFSTKILVIGLGGLGCPLLIYLINSGIKHIGLVDYDKIEISNLNRQIIFNEQDIGRFKTDKAKEVIKSIDKKIKINIYNEKLTKTNIKRIIKKFDIICDGTDNFETRYLINDYCLKFKKTLISAAINKFDGQIFNFDFKKKVPCFRCFMPEIPNQENSCDTDGVLSTLAGIAGTLQANEVIKTIIDKKNSMTGKMLIFNSLTSDFRKIKLTKNPNCIKECLKR